MSDAVVQAAVPSIVATLQAVKQFLANLGDNPAQVPLRLPGAVAVLVGTVELQFPALVGAELGAVRADVNNKLDGLIAKVQAHAAG